MPYQIDALNRCISDAASFCQFFLDLGPSGRETARYMADFGFVMISFACLFIIQACETFYSTIDAPDAHLSTVDDVAQLMKELAINSSHGSNFQSQNILAKLRQAYERIPNRAQTGDRWVGNPGTFQPIPTDICQDSFLMDPQWNMLDFFPVFPPQPY